jgi:NAD dependent epimerase/dehydratase
VNLVGCQVLVTGAGGFIGSHLCEALLAEGARVRALVSYDARGSWGWLDALPGRDALEVVAGDVRDAASVDDAVRGTTAVFHLAALIGIPYSYRAPDAYLETNVKGTLHVLQAARRHGVERVLVTSTSEVYGSARSVPMREDHPLTAQSPYAASKIAADKLAESFARSFGLPVTIVRPFNCFGPRQSTRAVIPAIIVQLLAGGPLRLGSLEPRRDFTYVADTARAFIAIARSEATRGEEVHVASGVDVAIGELAEELVRRLAPGTPIVLDDERLRPAGSEVLRLLGDASRLRALTDFAPRFDLARGLEETIAWFRDPANLARYRAEGYQV